VRIAITGASGNAGTSVLEALAGEPRVDSVLGIARRLPEWNSPKTEWAAADIREADLRALFSGVDAVVHLAWAIQPSRDQRELAEINVGGSRRVFEAARAAGVRTLVHASSVGAYSPAPRGRVVDESWPAGGIATSSYSRHKAETEAMLNRLEREAPEMRIVRLRPALIFKREAASEIARYFAGPLLPGPLLRPGLLPVVPGVQGLEFQAVHSLDVGDAYRLALVGDVSGAFNLAADPPLDSGSLASALGARSVALPQRAVRAAANLAWRLRLQPTSPGWLDMGLGSPLMATTRARAELGWSPRHTATDTLSELLGGIREGDGMGTPPLRPRAQLRLRELATRVGGTNP
jgi:UDP-glucose 4-epimerase